MSFFDRFKKTSNRAGRDDDFLPEIISAYGLKKAKPYEPSIEQDWWEGYYGTVRLAVQEWGNDIHVYLGDVVEITEIYLGRVMPGGKLPPESSPQRLDRIVGTEGTDLARQFVLLAHPQGDFDYPQLRLTELLHGLPRLTGSVAEFAIYENFRGLLYTSRQPIRRSDFDHDLGIASGVVNALSSWADRASLH